MTTSLRALAIVATGLIATPLAAQDAAAPAGPPSGEDTVFDDTWLSVGIGGIYTPSYDGSDDYTFSVIPIVQGRLGPVGIDPRPAGLALDFLPDAENGVDISAGVAARIRRNRASDIKDPVVEQYGELDTAIEVGPTLGVSFPGVLHQYDSLSFNADLLFDVAGAHGGMTVSPSVTYFTPLSRAAIVSLTLSANYANDDYADYYYTVPAAPDIDPADRLPTFQADGGFDKAGVNLLFGYDLDGNALNGGLALIGLAGYSRLLGDAKDTPFTSIRGSADQWMVAAGVGYTF
ncbi:MipA/OmpV family protein [Qipengyuania sp. 6B39]|uniref:MipA/OmpV family protein n=1 Tax=Qipengyuania proteolytica TaxID=2867239 RepID=UPI001C898679|nr:MipA/OmpV family protein [Qipengyuania proteolytica]MBX7496924.1 MipA/OmpV family protein [Qipengyuania proteolytica]